MEDVIVEFLLSGLYHYGYCSLFLMTFLEAAVLLGVLIPGETLVIMAGLAASKGIFDIHEVVWVSALGAILGDTAGYFMGAWFGEKIFVKFGKYLRLKEERLNDARSFFKNHGGKTVFLGRFMSLLRALAPTLAGMTRMPYPKFLCCNISGGVLWAMTFTLIGYFIGNSWNAIRQYFTYILLSGVTLGAFGYLSALLARRRPGLHEKTVLKYKKLLIKLSGNL